jgi:hypothetical protein
LYVGGIWIGTIVDRATIRETVSYGARCLSVIVR